MFGTRATASAAPGSTVISTSSSPIRRVPTEVISNCLTRSDPNRLNDHPKNSPNGIASRVHAPLRIPRLVWNSLSP